MHPRGRVHLADRPEGEGACPARRGDEGDQPDRQAPEVEVEGLGLPVQEEEEEEEEGRGLAAGCVERPKSYLGRRASSGVMKPVDPSKVYRLLYPAVPAIISCSDAGLTYAMPVVSVISLSGTARRSWASPPPRQHSTHQAIVKARCFSLSWVDASLVRSLEVLGTTQRSDGRQAPVGRADARAREDARRPRRRGRCGVARVLPPREARSRRPRAARRDGRRAPGRPRTSMSTGGSRPTSRVLYAGIQEGSFRTYQTRRGQSNGAGSPERAGRVRPALSMETSAC